MSGGSGASPLLPADSVRRLKLPNGLTVLVRRDPSAPVVAIVTHVKAGYFDETDDVGGIAHVLEHMYFKGTATRGVGEISRATKAAGGFLNAGTIYDQTSYYTVLPASAFERGLQIQFDAYAHSLIDAGELARELEVIIQEAKRKEDNPSAVAVETLYELMHDRHRMRRWRIGREEGLRRLTRDDLLNGRKGGRIHRSRDSRRRLSPRIFQISRSVARGFSTQLVKPRPFRARLHNLYGLTRNF